VRLAHKEKPDLIILDVRMPAGSGVSVYENLKLSTETAMTPVIYVTAYANDNLREKVEEMGAAGFLAKPFEADDLLALVRQALGDDTPEQPDEK
jgi:CheY-like chemotaxis protein